MAGSPIRLPVLLGALVVALLAACGEEGDDDSALRRALPTEIALEDMRKTASEQQIDLFTDGLIDFADLERATFNFIECIEDAGFLVKSAPVYDEKKLRFQFVFGPPGNNPEAGTEDLSRCMRGELAFVGEAWEAQHQPTQAERDNAMAVLRECLREAGSAELADTITIQQIPDLLADNAVGATVARCMTHVVVETGVRLG